MHPSSYVVLARKWRPAQFKDIVGQNHIVRTLINAVRSNRIHQAYLFTGSRGIGKTSIARIFAKVIRCEKTREENGSIYSCDLCASCREISAGSSVDVIEIDGASNNGVEAVREIRENVKYMPANGSRKIYIIDEVHMLTTAAFNALLKTLEEPPPHVIFIFATTEPHKIPATVLSRCQRFDYRRVSIQQIQTRLEEVTYSEQISVESGALALIGRAAEGSMRDALSLLDQVIAFSGTQISVQSTRESIGLIEGQILVQILSRIFSRKPLDALSQVDRVHEQGHDLRLLTRGLIEFLHATILLKIGSTHLGGLEVSEEEIAELKMISDLRSLEEMELIFQVLHHGLEWIARSPQPKIVLNILLIKCATAEMLIPIQETNSTPGLTAPISEAPTKSPGIAAAAVTPSSAIAAALSTSRPTPRIEAENPAQMDSSPAVSSHTQPIEKSWEGLIDHIRKSRPLLATILEHSSGTHLPRIDAPSVDRNLVIYFSPEEAYFREQLQARIYQEQLSTLSKEYLGLPVRLQIETRTQGESVAARREREQKERTESVKEKAQNHPIILEAKSLFGGELGPIDLKENNHAANPS